MPRQYKNVSAEPKNLLVLELPQVKSAAISKPTDSWVPSSRSYVGLSSRMYSA